MRWDRSFSFLGRFAGAVLSLVAALLGAISVTLLFNGYVDEVAFLAMFTMFFGLGRLTERLERR